LRVQIYNKFYFTQTNR